MIKSYQVKTEVVSLNSTWTVEVAKDLESYYSFDSTQNLEKILAKEFRKQKRKDFIQKVLLK